MHPQWLLLEHTTWAKAASLQADSAAHQLSAQLTHACGCQITRPERGPSFWGALLQSKPKCGVGTLSVIYCRAPRRAGDETGSKAAVSDPHKPNYTGVGKLRPGRAELQVQLLARSRIPGGPPPAAPKLPRCIASQGCNSKARHTPTLHTQPITSCSSKHGSNLAQQGQLGKGGRGPTSSSAAAKTRPKRQAPTHSRASAGHQTPSTRALTSQHYLARSPQPQPP